VTGWLSARGRAFFRGGNDVTARSLSVTGHVTGLSHDQPSVYSLGFSPILFLFLSPSSLLSFRF
jgi:hypothetical protein